MLLRTYAQAIPVLTALEKRVYEETTRTLQGKPVTVRELLPSDLVDGKEDWSFSNLTGWTKIVDLTVPDNTYIGIAGFQFQNNSTITQVKIKVGGAEKRIIPVALALDGSDHGRNVFLGKDEVLVVQPNSNLEIWVYSTADSGSPATENIVIYGKVGEQLGKKVMKEFKG